MANPVKEIDHPIQVIREISVFVRQYIWPDGASSYDVHLSDGVIRDEAGEPTDCLTWRGSFDHMPAVAEIEALPYIAPGIVREYPGVFFIYTGPYKKGPYPTRGEARADIRKGNW